MVARRDGRDREAISARELMASFPKGCRQPTDTPIARKELLRGDAARGLVRGGQLDALLDLDHLMQTARPGAARGDSTGMAIDNLDAPFVNQIVAIALVTMQRCQRHADPIVADPLEAP